jgi:hypothetical protein
VKIFFRLVKIIGLIGSFMDDIEFAFFQITSFLDALRENNNHVLSESDKENLAEASKLISQTQPLCDGEWRQNPLRKRVKMEGGKAIITDY